MILVPGSFDPEQPPGTIVGLGSRPVVKYGIVVETFRLPRSGRGLDNELVKLRNVALKLLGAYFFTKNK